MRSYYAHLATTEPTPPGAIAPRPVLRSSAIFPVIQREGIFSRILFMGYWMLKRNINKITTIVTLRNELGKILARKTFPVTEARSFRVELADELERAGLDRHSVFAGSLEIEFFSTENLVFPYPAAVINYYGPQFSTVVHTAQRIYNDFEDMKKNSQTEVPESGFNVYADSEREPFIGLINGGTRVPKSLLRMQFLNHQGDRMEHTCDLGPLEPYATKWIYPAEHCDLRKFLEQKPGSAKITFNLDWVFPRLVVGNVHHKIPAMTITHTYYDCSHATSESDYWRQEEPGWHASALMLPAEVSQHHFTNIYFYPIYSPSTFAVDIEFYSADGTLVGTKKEAVRIEKSSPQVRKIELKSLYTELKMQHSNAYALRLIARPLREERVPARIKIGFDVGSDNENTPCNICTNLQPFNPSLENKPTSFRWSPVLADQPQATIWIMNSSPSVNYTRSASITITYFRESDTKTLVRPLTLPPHGFSIIRINEDAELKDFFQGKVGWMTATTSNPYTTTYYFAENASGVVGGDHGF